MSRHPTSLCFCYRENSLMRAVLAGQLPTFSKRLYQRELSDTQGSSQNGDSPTSCVTTTVYDTSQKRLR